MLNVQHVSRHFHKSGNLVKALDDVSLTVSDGEFVAVRGPSGSGKSTLLFVIGGLLRPTSGTVTLGDERVDAMPAEALARFRARRVGFIFQQFHLVPYLSVRDNILAATLACPVDDAPSRADALIESVGLADRRNHLPGELSAGEQQRVAIARASLVQPRLLLADEPTGNLDEANARQVAAHLRSYADGGKMVLLVTHDAAIAGEADRVLALRGGAVQSVK